MTEEVKTTRLFRHHPDGFIRIQDGELQIDCSLSDFLKLEPRYSLPAEASSREYIQGESHVLTEGNDSRFVGKDWGTGDGYISNVAHYQSQMELLKTEAELEVAETPRMDGVPASEQADQTATEQILWAEPPSEAELAVFHPAEQEESQELTELEIRTMLVEYVLLLNERQRTNYVKAHSELKPYLTEEEVWKLVRDIRNQRLAASDWTQLPDAPLSESQKAAWSQYRQELRDLTNTYKDSFQKIIWPSEPE